MSLYCGIDIGGTSVKSILMNDSQEVFSSDHFETDSESGPDQFIDNLSDSIIRQIESLDTVQTLTAIGIGCTGPINVETGVILNPYTLPGLQGLCLPQELRKRIHVPVTLENDANTAHLGEVASFNQPVPPNTLLMTIGTGVGCSIRSGGELFRIPGGIHPEIGHIATGSESDVACYCGKTNCMENTLSGTAINRDAKRLFGLTPEEILDNCDTPAKLQFREGLISGLTNSIASLTGIFNCEMVFIVGGMRRFYEKYVIDDCQKKIDLLENIFGGTKIVRTEPNYYTGCLGAAILAMNQFRREDERNIG